MNRFVLISSLLLALGSSGGLYAQESATLSVSDSWGEPGSSGNGVNVNLANSMGVAGVQFVLKFDGSLLTAANIAVASHASNMNIGSNIWSDSLKVLLFSMTGDSISPGEGAIVQVMFDVDNSAVPGNSTLLHLKDCVLSDPEAQPIPCVAEDGWFYFVKAPVADFTGSPTSGGKPLTVNFTDQSTNTPTSWSWEFGDGGTSTEQNPSHTYNSTGTFTVKLTATNSWGSDTKTKTNYITVYDKPSADFIADDTIGCIPFIVNFTDQSSNNPTSWSWEFGDGGTSTEQNPSHTYKDSSGDYTVILIATNSCGSDTATKLNYIHARAPDITVEPLSFSMALVEGDSADTVMYIKNMGPYVGACGLEFDITVLTDTLSWLSVSPASGSIDPDSTFEITVMFRAESLGMGSHSGCLSVHSNDPVDSIVSVICSLKVEVGIEEDELNTPNSYTLSQNSPNPAYSVTRISFGVPKDVRVLLNIYDIVGRPVCTLVNGIVRAGYHTINWDCRDANGKKVASGIYFYHSEAGDFNDTKKLILLR